jgi:uncharacterized membrane protein
MVTAAKHTSLVVFHMTVAFSVMWAVTGSPAFGGIAAIVEPVTVVVLAPLHQKAWAWVERRLAERAALRDDHPAPLAAPALAARFRPAPAPQH